MRALLLGLLLAGCAQDNQARDGGDDLDFDLAGVRLRVASGTARVEGTALALYLTDQPNACLAIKQVPVGTATFFVLRVAAQADGTTAAEVKPAVAGTLPPGQAAGRVTVQTTGVTSATREATAGTVSWTVGEGGSATIVALDVGFADTATRVVASGLTIPGCTP